MGDVVSLFPKVKDWKEEAQTAADELFAELLERQMQDFVELGVVTEEQLDEREGLRLFWKRYNHIAICLHTIVCEQFGVENAYSSVYDIITVNEEQIFDLDEEFVEDE